MITLRLSNHRSLSAANGAVRRNALLLLLDVFPLLVSGGGSLAAALLSIWFSMTHN